MGRPKKPRPAQYKSYYDKDVANDNEIPESTLRYRNQQHPNNGGVEVAAQDRQEPRNDTEAGAAAQPNQHAAQAPSGNADEFNVSEGSGWTETESDEEHFESTEVESDDYNQIVNQHNKRSRQNPNNGGVEVAAQDRQEPRNDTEAGAAAQPNQHAAQAPSGNADEFNVSEGSGWTETESDEEHFESTEVESDGSDQIVSEADEAAPPNQQTGHNPNPLNNSISSYEEEYDEADDCTSSVGEMTATEDEASSRSIHSNNSDREYDAVSIHSENSNNENTDESSSDGTRENNYGGFNNEDHMRLWDHQEEQAIAADLPEANEHGQNNDERLIPEDLITGTEGFEKLLSKLNGPYLQDIGSQPTVNPNDIIQMLLGLAKRHRWTHQEKEDVMKMTNWVLGKRVLPDTRFLMDSIFSPKTIITYFFYCCECTTLLGSNDLIEARVQVMNCPNGKCAHANAISDLSKASYFVCFDVQSQIALLLQDPDVRRKLLDPRNLIRAPHDGVLRDVYDGSVYRKFLTYIDHSCDTHYLSVSMSVDGVALFVNGTCSITPCFIMINELPPVIRMEKLILAGLWFGKKVQTDLFLPPVVAQIRQMSETGFNIKVEDQVYWNMKVYLLSVVADSGMRYDLQGIHSHRGEFSCSWCLHSGEELAGARKFRFSFPFPPLRTLPQMIEDADEAIRTKKVIRGVKCLSVLTAAPYFHPIDGMVVDKLHATDEGVAKAFTLAWMGDEGAAPWTIKEKHHSKIESRISQARYPIEIRKAFRKIKHRARYTAREWENWTLFFSVPVLSDILQTNLLVHWSLFVQAEHLLLRTEITEDLLNIANELLIEFVAKIEILYGPEMMTFNVHLLCHLILNIIRHGPLFALSAYAFEAGNQILKKIIFASNGIPNQVCRFIMLGHATQIMKMVQPSEDANLFLAKTKKKNQALIKHVGKAELHGYSTSFSNPNAQEQWLLNKHKINKNNCVLFKKVKVNGVTYETYKPSRKLDNSVALLTDESALQVKKILLDEVTQAIYVFGVKLRCRPSKFCPASVARLKKISLCFLLDVLSVDEELICVPLPSLKSIFVNMKLSNKHTLSPVPNIYNMF